MGHGASLRNNKKTTASGLASGCTRTALQDIAVAAEAVKRFRKRVNGYASPKTTPRDGLMLLSRTKCAEAAAGG